MNEEKITTKRIIVYLSIVFGILYTPWIIGLIVPSLGNMVYAIVRFPVVFMGTPALSVLITRKMTADKSPLPFSFKILKRKKAFLFSVLIPGLAILSGTALFFLIFPNDVDYHARFILEKYGAFGVPKDLELTLGVIVIMGLIVYLVSVIAVPIWFIALGEDIGWQGYLLPLLCKKMPAKCAVLVNGALWGLAHAPIIYYGMNYGTNYQGAPYSGMAMFIIVAIVLGTWMSYITLKTQNCLYAAIIHGASDIVGEFGTWISLATVSSLLGPTPSGIIGLSGLFVGAAILFLKMPDSNN